MKINSDISPELSVIIPFHNSAEYIQKCLKSVTKAVHISHEIICVNDGSTDNSTEIVNNFCEKNKSISLISFDKQIKLYHARLAGIKQARGRYIGFVDSDDFVSRNYFDKLYAEAEKSDADISVSTVVNVDIRSARYIQTRCADFPYVSDKSDLGKPLYELYWKQSGRCYHWHVLWNKIYRRELWEKALPVLERQNEPLVMLEDFIYSSLILQNARSYAVSKKSRYFYVAHNEASVQSSDPDKIKDYISDMKHAFEFIKAHLKASDNLSDYSYYLDDWRERYGRYWKRNIIGSPLSEIDILHCLRLLREMTVGEIADVSQEDEWFYEKAKTIK